jgi:Flp pilus assembly protein TadD
VVLVVLDFYPLRRFPPGRGGWYEVSARGVWLEKIPFFLLAGVVLITFQGRLHPGALFADEPVDAHFSYFSRAMQAFYVWAYYVWRPWMPFGLSPVYVALVNFNPWGWQFVASAAGVIGLTGLLIWKRRVWAPVLGLWICHLALLVPALGLTEHPHYASDRYSHVDGVLWVALIAAGCVRLSRRRNPAWLLAAVLAVDALFGALSVRQIRIWRDTPTLFNYMADQLGNHPYRISIRLHLGTWYLDHGRVAEAAGQFERAVAEAPNSSNARDLFGETLFWLGRTNEAVFQLREAVRLSPNYLDARRNLALTLAKQGKPDEAVEQAGAALKLAPNNPDVEELLAVLLCNQNRLDEAIDHFRAALKIQPGFIAALNGLGVALFKQGRISEAVSQFQRALQLKPDDAEARENLRAALQQKPSP